MVGQYSATGGRQRIADSMKIIKNTVFFRFSAQHLKKPSVFNTFSVYAGQPARLPSQGNQKKKLFPPANEVFFCFPGLPGRRPPNDRVADRPANFIGFVLLIFSGKAIPGVLKKCPGVPCGAGAPQQIRRFGENTLI